MPTDIHEQLRRLGDDALAESAPIGLDELIEHSADTSTEQHSLGRNHRPRRRMRRLHARAAVVLVGTAAAMVGLLVVAVRHDPAPVADQPDATILPEAMGPAGSLILGEPVAGWQLQSVSDDRVEFGDDTFVRRIYIADTARPENGPALIVDSFDADVGSPNLASSTETITVNGTDGHRFDRDAGGVGLAFELDGFWFDLTAYGLTDEQLVDAANSTVRAVDGDGAIVSSAGLPAELTVETVGTRGESWFLSRDALDDPIPGARWADGDRSIWFDGLAQDPTLDRFQRIGAATITDTTVDGQPAFLRTIAGQDDFLSLTWHADGRTNVLGSLGVSGDELVEFAEALRQPDAAEWTAALTSVAPPVACVGDDCDGVPEAGSIVPTGAELFPLVDEALTPDDGRGPTLAQYTYFGGIDGGGSAWRGFVGPPAVTIYDDLVTITVSLATDAEPLPVEPGRTADVGEYDYGSGVELVKSYPNDIVVVVQGRDIDQLYDLLDHIEPTRTDGALDGYRLVGELPDDLEEIEAAFERSFDDGAYPSLQIHRDTLLVSIRPGPALGDISGFIGPIERVDVGERIGFVHERPQNDYVTLAVELENGDTMTVSGSDFTRQELIDIAAGIELVDEQTWNERYDPILPIIPRIVEDMTATTEPIDPDD